MGLDLDEVVRVKSSEELETEERVEKQVFLDKRQYIPESKEVNG